MRRTRRVPLGRSSTQRLRLSSLPPRPSTLASSGACPSLTPRPRSAAPSLLLHRRQGRARQCCSRGGTIVVVRRHWRAASWLLRDVASLRPPSPLILAGRKLLRLRPLIVWLLGRPPAPGLGGARRGRLPPGGESQAVAPAGPATPVSAGPRQPDRPVFQLSRQRPCQSQLQVCLEVLPLPPCGAPR